MGFARTNCFWVFLRRELEVDRETDIEKEKEIIPVQVWVCG